MQAELSRLLAAVADGGHSTFLLLLEAIEQRELLSGAREAENIICSRLDGSASDKALTCTEHLPHWLVITDDWARG